MAFIRRLGSQTSYLHFPEELVDSTSSGVSDDDSLYTPAGLDRNNNDEGNYSPLILSKSPSPKQIPGSQDLTHFKMNESNTSFEQFVTQDGNAYDTTKFYKHVPSPQSNARFHDKQCDYMPWHEGSDEFHGSKSNTDVSSCGESYREVNSPCDSSNDESEAEVSENESSRLAKGSSDRSDLSVNSNNNNNKKKSRLPQNGTDSRTVNFRVQTQFDHRRRIRKASRTNSSSVTTGRKHGNSKVYISSLRATSNSFLGRQRTPHLLKYNQRLINPDGSPNIRIKVKQLQVHLLSIGSPFYDKSTKNYLFPTVSDLAANTCDKTMLFLLYIIVILVEELEPVR